MRKLVPVALVAVLLLAFGTASSEQGKRKSGEAKGKQKRVGCLKLIEYKTDELGISDEQKQKIDELSKAMKENSEKIFAEKKALLAELQELRQADEPDTEKIEEAEKKLSELKTKMRESHDDLATNLKEILTEEQWEKVKEKCSGGLGEKFGGKQGKMHKMGEECEKMTEKDAGGLDEKFRGKHGKMHHKGEAGCKKAEAQESESEQTE